MYNKQQLLATNYFNDDEYLDKYCELIELNKNTKKESFKTQSHHIIPRCYYKLNNIEIDNSKENLVNLKYIDHVWAHIYLFYGAKEEKFKYKMFIAVCYILGNKNYKLQDFYKLEKHFIENQKDYLEAYEKYVKMCSKRWSGENNPHFGIHKNFGTGMAGKNHKATSIQMMVNKRKGHRYAPLSATENSINTRRIVVQNLDTGEIFKSIKEAVDKYPKATFIKQVIDKGFGKSGGYYWAIVDKVLENIGYSKEEALKIIEDYKNNKKEAISIRTKKQSITMNNKTEEEKLIEKEKRSKSMKEMWASPEGRIKSVSRTSKIIEYRNDKFLNIVNSIDKEELYNNYIVKRMKVEDLLNIYNVTQWTFFKILKYFNISKKKN